MNVIPPPVHHITVVDRSNNRERIALAQGAAAPPPQTVAAVMSRDVICARDDVELRTIEWLLAHHDISGVPVVDGERRPLGTVTCADLVRAASEGRLEDDGAYVDSFDPVRAAPPLRTAASLMRLVPAVRATDSLAAVADVLRARRVHAVAVVDAEGRLVGIVSAIDLLRGLPDASRD